MEQLQKDIVSMKKEKMTLFVSTTAFRRNLLDLLGRYRYRIQSAEYRVQITEYRVQRTVYEPINLHMNHKSFSTGNFNIIKLLHDLEN